MIKLKKFNQLFNKIIYQNINFKDQFQGNTNNSDSFYLLYVKPIADQLKISSQKQRYNVFRIYGPVSKIISFFKKLNVNKKYLKDELKQFNIYSPMFCLGETTHDYNNGKDNALFDRTHSQGNELIDAGQKVDTTRCNDDFVQNKIEGRWEELYDNTLGNSPINDDVPKKVYSCTPIQMSKLLKTNLENKNITNQQQIYVEFEVNTDGYEKNSFSQNASQSLTDKQSQQPQSSTKNLPGDTKKSEQPLIGQIKRNLRNKKTSNFNQKK